MDRCGQFCTALARLDIDGRLAAITEAQAAQLSEVIERVLIALGVSDHPRRDPRVAPVVARELRAIGTGGGD
jgi:predicted RNase H-like nuclease (RuvC/YqgF family)